MLRCSHIYAGFIVAMGLSCGLVIAQDSSPIFEPPPISVPATMPGAVQNGGRLPSFPSSANARPLVVDVIIQGARDEERARSYIRTKKEYEFDEGILQADVRRLITSNQFQNVRTMKKQVVEGVVVIFELTERPRINYILFHGNRGYTDKKLLKVCELKQGEPMNAYEVEEGRRRLEEHYHSKGYPKAQIGILEGDKPTDKGVAYAISEGYLQRIAEVSFEGNTFASDSVLKTKIESKPGFMWLFFNGKLNRQKLDSDVEKLTAYYHDFGFFRARVGREITFDEEGKWATLKFVIEEGQRYHVRNVSIVGNEKFRTEPVLDALTLKSNKPFSRGEMNKDLTLIRSHAHS
jgi:outer membrane protein insertion porin family